jgi:hypothetical protein
MAYRIAKYSYTKEKLSDLVLGQLITATMQVRRLKVIIQDIHEEKMAIFVLVSAKP